jgi:hypothetical protein
VVFLHHTILYSYQQRYSEKELAIADSREARGHYRHNAKQAIDQILKTIRRYEQKWMVPAGA